MKTIGLISDTHSYLDPQIFTHFKAVDEIWHIGDIGTVELLAELQAFKPTKAVWGNIDNEDIRHETEEIISYNLEGLKFLLIHIGGLPPKYNSTIKKLLKEYKPDVFLCGHSHILRVIKDKEIEPPVVYINPGAAGHHGFHHTRTIMRMYLDNGKITNLEVIELGPK